MDEAEVRAVLGEPLAVTDEESGCCGWLRQLSYPTMVIGLVQGMPPDLDSHKFYLDPDLDLGRQG